MAVVRKKNRRPVGNWRPGKGYQKGTKYPSGHPSPARRLRGNQEIGMDVLAHEAGLAVGKGSTGVKVSVFFFSINLNRLC
jgi:hypothetical protein